MKRGLLLTTLLAAGLLLSLLTWWPFQSRPVADGRAHLEHLRSSGLLAGARAQTRLGEVRRIVPVATRWSAPGEPFWWAELTGPDGSAGYLAWREGGDRRPSSSSRFKARAGRPSLRVACPPQARA